MNTNTILLLALGAAAGLLLAVTMNTRHQEQVLPAAIPESNDETWQWEDWRGRPRVMNITRNIRYRGD